MGDSQMYDWIGRTVNPLAGACKHNCGYCYMKPLKTRFATIREKYSGEPRIDEKGLAQINGVGKTFFVGSSTDLFAENVPSELIIKILLRCGQHGNTYLFQTKNPKRYSDFWRIFPVRTILGVTIEGTYTGKLISKAPPVWSRLADMVDVANKAKMALSWSCKTHISIEPVMPWSADGLDALRSISPDIISVGANTSHVKLPEPTADELLDMIERFRDITADVRLKNNLKRIIPDGELFALQTHIAYEKGAGDESTADTWMEKRYTG